MTGEVTFEIVDGVEYARLRAEDLRTTLRVKDALYDGVKQENERLALGPLEAANRHLQAVRDECERQFQDKVARVNELEAQVERLNDEKQAFNTWIQSASQREETLRTELRDEHDMRVDTEHALHQRQLGERAKLVETLTYHWATQTAGCSCGWGELGKSWPEHVADVYEASRPVSHRKT